LRWYNLDHLRVEVNRLRGAGETELHDPWPGPDRDFGKGGIWHPYSNEQILARAAAVYAGALEGYQQLVDVWFPKLAPRMRTAVTLPARLVGVVVPPRTNKGIEGVPRIDWYLEALPHGSRSTVDLRLGEDRMGVENIHLASDRLRSLRPEAVAWLNTVLHHGVLEILHPNSATELAYSWLWDDLRQVSWVEGSLGRL
jgi:hypothetical protein